ncbi:MAG: 30S ribosomal protein S16 [Candidatus Saccharimonadales bacterium]
MQRTGRTGHAMFRVIVQDSRRTPTSGNVVAFLGSYNPHTKAISLDKEKAISYLKHGAQPSERIALLLRGEGVKLPKWVVINQDKKGKVRNESKLNKDQPKVAPVTETPAGESETAEAPIQEVEESPIVESIEISPKTAAESEVVEIPEANSEAPPSEPSEPAAKTKTEPAIDNLPDETSEAETV